MDKDEIERIKQEVKEIQSNYYDDITVDELKMYSLMFVNFFERVWENFGVVVYYGNEYIGIEFFVEANEKIKIIYLKESGLHQRKEIENYIGYEAGKGFKEEGFFNINRNVRAFWHTATAFNDILEFHNNLIKTAKKESDNEYEQNIKD